MKQERKRLQFEYITRKPIQLPLKRREILVYLDHISLQSLWSSQSSSQKVDRLWPFLQPGKSKLNRQKIGNAKNWFKLSNYYLKAHATPWKFCYKERTKKTGRDSVTWYRVCCTYMVDNDVPNTFVFSPIIHQHFQFILRQTTNF